ncbi:CDP-diacylglycerol--glycerol-3-phosphate 3-phosphatidyltransferase [Halomonas litopenaei]|uniref:CDP-diacylglycerol--glycerol-3-phosphate 3-phosphatidyltransferase n=3 Tax=Halomonas TaxID=2745 RepID=A0AAU7KCM0_9GAMM|nr:MULTISPECIES: CDP-diacylglycerol--glycerol-3-phosphate 3-phosphatidyltransferase [Halomonas]MBR9881614.1 CDP-diacylglycerol--glycerol-3-phosphate 3-phosphatidyltransferase [Gammaproteobacteria bacterium]MAR71059.1 CDP-diacylglycerol--glycerol-3-phosphate 3-phosphatidyltransferase [Halomonas sp.]MBY5943083.1 CDP-diacylglycerol--glycerol-3-phosphate 3-phosphatidyltransferase [Halomonas sp. DP5N14-9]PTL88814.1 CDP-diacylglycerol--glycerol-3-phosphate 3-phosphatidyltransferase [Halomonas sp. SYS|tara:strand:+ start:430 stop:978 length:549 start_codon:yes stop_codon:yes gene_type:complete
MNIPNILTLARIVFIPLLVVLFYLPFEYSMLTAAALFGLASITDWLDGYLARKWDQSTPFGAFLDPVADKLMVAVALALLIERYDAAWLTLPALVIIGREIVISALREWMAEMGKRGSVAVSWIGKVKTTLQMVALLLLLAFPPGHLIAELGVVTLYAAAILTLWSMIQYLRAAWPHLSRSL